MPSLASCRLIVFALVILVLGFPTFARAQKDAGSIVGTVKDPTGALVSNAKVTVTDVERASNFSATTNDAGEYVAGPFESAVIQSGLSIRDLRRPSLSPSTLTCNSALR